MGIFLNKSTRWQRPWSKTHQIKKGHHFEKPTFWVLQIYDSYPGWFVHFKFLKNAPCLWFGCFSSDVKSVCLQRFKSELKARIILVMKHKVVVLKKLFFQSGIPFFDSMHFRPWPLPSAGYIQKIPSGHGFHLTRENWLQF